MLFSPLEGINVGVKALQEHFETFNHSNTIYCVQDIIRKDEPFSEWQIRNMHQLILKNFNDNYVGRYRLQNVLITGVTTIRPDYILLNDKLAQLVDWYNSEIYKLLPIESTAKVRANFATIHQFMIIGISHLY